MSKARQPYIMWQVFVGVLVISGIYTYVMVAVVGGSYVCMCQPPLNDIHILKYMYNREGGGGSNGLSHLLFDQFKERSVRDDYFHWHYVTPSISLLLFRHSRQPDECSRIHWISPFPPPHPLKADANHL